MKAIVYNVLHKQQTEIENRSKTTLSVHIVPIVPGCEICAKHLWKCNKYSMKLQVLYFSLSLSLSVCWLGQLSPVVSYLPFCNSAILQRLVVARGGFFSSGSEPGGSGEGRADRYKHNRYMICNTNINPEAIFKAGWGGKAGINRVH